MVRSRCAFAVAIILAAGIQGTDAMAAQTTAPSLQWNVEQLDKLLAADPASDVVHIGDMVFKRETIRQHRDRLAAGSEGGQTGSAGMTGATFWTGGNVYYSFDANVSAA